MEVLKPLRRIKHLFVFHSRRLLPLCVAVHQQHARRILRHHHHEHRLLEDRSRTVEVDDVEAPELVQHPDLLRELRHCILACVNLLQSLDRHAVTAERPFVTISKVPSEICRSMWTSVGGSFVVMTVRSLSASWSVAWVWRSMAHAVNASSSSMTHVHVGVMSTLNAHAFFGCRIVCFGSVSMTVYRFGPSCRSGASGGPSRRSRR